MRFIDLFAGIGGFRLAAESLGHQCVFSSEWDKYCQKTYEANFGEIPYGDITQINPLDIPNHDLLLAGFPCQPFSSIGRREGFEHITQGTLFFNLLEILKIKKPVNFVLENVAGLITHDKGRTLEIILSSLKDLGYTVQYKVLDALDFGSPARRKRIFIVGNLLDKSYQYPVGRCIPTFFANHLEIGAVGYSISKKLQDSYLYKKDDGKPQIITPATKEPLNTLVASYHKIQRLTGTFVRDGETGLRLLSQSECLFIMGFPQGFEMPVSRTQMYRQLGNSVHIPTVKAVLTNL